MLDQIRRLIPEQAREAYYRFASALVMLLFGLEVFITTAAQADAWLRLATSVITLLFAALYATTKLRVALYLVAGPLMGVLQIYGMASDEKAALVVSAVGQALGIATAAAKTVQRGVSPVPPLPTAA
ncbi:phage holin [Mycolicibacterium palauense]|uniref:phage holin n=1 Tax=Mycolicibacterium palauense TaxID=2034511 RepID=UPI001C3F40DF|nr:hypothetical protein [Mycolicibacterium palauense]